MKSVVDVVPQWESELFNELIIVHELDECAEHKGIAKDGELAEGSCGSLFVYRKEPRSLPGKRCLACLQTPVRHAKCWFCHKEDVV